MKNHLLPATPHQHDRRHWLQTSVGTLLGAAGAGLSASAVAATGAPTVLTMAAAWPEKLVGLSDTIKRLIKRIETLSSKQLQIKVKFAGESGISPLEMLDAVSSGKVDMSHGTPYYWTKQSAGFNFFATVPFGMNANEHYAWLRYGGGMALWDKLARKHGVVVFPCGNTGIQMAGWMRQKITSVDSLHGLKLRYPGLGGEVLRRLGVVPVTMAATDIVPALRSGQLDGAEWISPWNDMQLGLHEVCNYYYVPGIHEPGHTMELLINPDVWAKLSPLQQDIVQTASWLEYSEALGQFNHENARSLDELRKLKNVEVLRLPNDVIRTFRKLAPEVIRDAVQGDALASEIYKSYAGYLQSQLRWAELADRAYWQARYI